MTLDNFLKKISKDPTIIGDSEVTIYLPLQYSIELIYGDDFIFNEEKRKFEILNPTRVVLKFKETDKEEYIQNTLGSLIERKYWFTNIFFGGELTEECSGLYYSVKKIAVDEFSLISVETTAIIGNTFIDDWQDYFKTDLEKIKNLLWNQFRVNGDVTIHGELFPFPILEEPSTSTATVSQPNNKKKNKNKRKPEDREPQSFTKEEN